MHAEQIARSVHVSVDKDLDRSIPAIGITGAVEGFLLTSTSLGTRSIPLMVATLKGGQ